MSKLSRDDAYVVSDSTDWLETPLLSLAPVDSALRCQVCRDFYKTPMMTDCCHTFCSLCIRQCLNNDGKCPTCRKGTDASRLKHNYAIEELVEAFERARPEIMDYAKKASQEAIRSASPKRKRMEVDEGSSPIRKRTRSGTRAQQLSSQQSIPDSDTEDADYTPEDKKSRKVLCPICQDAFPTVKAVEAHVDHCNGEPPSRKQSHRSSQTLLPPQPVLKPTKRPERLAQLHYGALKDNALRKKLQDLGISGTGSRQLMERRYTEWVTLWNANCDSKNPKQKGELRRELDIWERTQGGGALTSNRSNLGDIIKDKDFDRLAWSKKHDDPFRQLIVEAKRKKAVKIEAPEGALKEGSPSGSSVATSAMPAPYNLPSGPTLGSTMALQSADHPSITTEMTGSHDPHNSCTAPAPPGTRSSQRRVLEGSTISPSEPSSSQSQHPTAQIVDEDVYMDSDMATLRRLQP